jgi:zinc transporter ZupT
MIRFLPGDLFINAFASALAEILGVIIGGLFYKFTNLNWALFLSFALSMAGAFLLL